MTRNANFWMNRYSTVEEEHRALRRSRYRGEIRANPKREKELNRELELLAEKWLEAAPKFWPLARSGSPRVPKRLRSQARRLVMSQAKGVKKKFYAFAWCDYLRTQDRDRLAHEFDQMAVPFHKWLDLVTSVSADYDEYDSFARVLGIWHRKRPSKRALQAQLRSVRKRIAESSEPNASTYMLVEAFLQFKLGEGITLPDNAETIRSTLQSWHTSFCERMPVEIAVYPSTDSITYAYFCWHESAEEQEAEQEDPGTFESITKHIPPEDVKKVLLFDYFSRLSLTA